MKCKYILLSGVLVITIAFVVTEGKKEGRGNKGRGNSSRSNEGNETKCLGETLPSSKLLIGFDECTEEVVTLLSPKPLQQAGTPEEEKIQAKGRKKVLKKSQMCIKLCQRKKQGILDTSGAYSETGAENFVDGIFPQKVRPRMKRGLERCAEDAGEKFEVKENCKDFRRFEKCFTRIISKNCGWKNGKQKGNNRRGNKARKGNKGRKHGNNRGQDHHDDDEQPDEDDTETEPLDF